MPSVTFDTADLKAFAAAARKVDPAIARELRAGVRRAGKLVGDEAKRRAPSGRIAGTIKVQAAAYKATVSAGNPATPDAALYEHGGRQGFWRHPVFGNRNAWVSQQARPYLLPALKAMSEAAVAEIADSVDEGLLEVLG